MGSQKPFKSTFQKPFRRLHSADRPAEDFPADCVSVKCPQWTVGRKFLRRLSTQMPSGQMSPAAFWLKSTWPDCPHKTFGAKVFGPMVPRRLSVQMSPRDFDRNAFGTIVPRILSVQRRFGQLSSEEFWPNCPWRHSPEMHSGQMSLEDFRRKCLQPKSPQRPLGQRSLATFDPMVASDLWPSGPQRPLGERSPGTFGPKVAEDHWAKGR